MTRRLSVVLAALLGSCATPAVLPAHADVLIRGGTVYPGGGAPFVGDVAIEGHQIVAVGAFDAGAPTQTIDCTGLIICPGFIDLHNHSDQGMTTPGTRANMNFVLQGCTTVVTGNCGSGPVDAKAFLEKNRERNTFLYLHLMDPHSPYAPPDDLYARFGGPRPANAVELDSARGALAGLVRAARIVAERAE